MKAVRLGDAAGLLHPPEGAASGTAVLMVPPFGWDDQSAYRPRKAWAEALAADGHAVLRLELPGTGDASGAAGDESLLTRWQDAIVAAAEAFDAERLAVVALGLGGLLVAGLLDRLAVDDLVLWGAPSRGRAWIRELKAFAKLEAAQTGDEGAVSEAGDICAGGHLLTAQTAAAVAALQGASGTAGRALLLGRDGTPPDAALVEALGAETDPGLGWGAMLAGPQHAEIPHAVIARTRAWLPRPGGRVPALRESGPGAEAAVELPGGAFGVITAPAGGPAGLTLVCLNAGSIRHIGPNRMWVEAGRRWAQRGVASARIDLPGIGEASGSPEPIGDDAKYYVPELTALVPPVLDALAERGLPPRFLLTGLCSGAYWALHTAASDSRVCGAVLLNPRLLFWDPEAGGRRELRRALSVLTPAGFRRLLRADRPLQRLGAMLRWLVTRPFRRAEAAPPSDLDAVLERLASRGQRLELAFSGDEPLHDELRRAGDDAKLTIHPLPFRSHTLKPLAAQAAAHAVLDAAIERAAQ